MTNDMKHVLKKHKIQLDETLGKKATNEERAKLIEDVMGFISVLAQECMADLNDRDWSLIELNTLLMCKIAELKADSCPCIECLEEAECLEDHFNKMVGYEHFKI